MSTKKTAVEETAHDLDTVPEITAPETLVADLAAWVAGELAALPAPWQTLGEDARRETLQRLRVRAFFVAQRLCDIAAGCVDVSHVVAVLESVTVKQGTKATLTVRGSSHALVDSVGSVVRVLVTPDAADIFGHDPAERREEQRPLFTHDEES